MIALEEGDQKSESGQKGRVRPLANRKRLRCLSSRDLVEC
jgi:hypothetical protein